jgi:hypothetical protein
MHALEIQIVQAGEGKIVSVWDNLANLSHPWDYSADMRENVVMAVATFLALYQSSCTAYIAMSNAPGISPQAITKKGPHESEDEALRYACLQSLKFCDGVPRSFCVRLILADNPLALWDSSSIDARTAIRKAFVLARITGVAARL